MQPLDNGLWEGLTSQKSRTHDQVMDIGVSQIIAADVIILLASSSIDHQID